MSRAARVTGALAAAALAACAVGPDYERPEVTVPQSYRGATAANAAPIDTRWWTLFGDPTLSALEEQARDGHGEREVAARGLGRWLASRAPERHEGQRQEADAECDGHDDARS